MNDQGLLLRSEPGIPTFISNHRHTGQTTVDLQLMSPSGYKWATVCKTDVEFEHSHFSDHRAIITELDLPDNPLRDLITRQKANWSKTDWERYSTTVNIHLAPALCTLLDTSTHPQQRVDSAAELITTAINKVVEASTPTLTVSQRSRRWWCAETLNPLKGHANNLRRKAQHTGAPDDRILYQAAQHKYQQACVDAKTVHWRDYLAKLTAKDLFTAAKYTNGPQQSRMLPPLKDRDGNLTSDPA